MDPLLIIGIVMSVTGIAVILLGRKRGVPNTILWALFPILHGGHEFADYLIESMGAPFIVERFEILFAYGASIILLAAAFEFNGAIPRPTGKLVGGTTMIFLVYFVFFLSEQNLEDISDTVFNFGVFVSEPNRFFYGFFLVILSAGIILISYLYLAKQAKLGKLSLGPHVKVINIAASVLLVFYAIFEGFDSTDPIFIQLRAVTLGVFIIVPLLVVLTTKPGLQRLLIIADTGELVYGYHFGLKTDIFDRAAKKELDNAILTAGFLAAISGFSGELGSKSSSFSIRTGGFYFSLLKVDTSLFALQSLNYNTSMENAFSQFTTKIDKALLVPTHQEPVNSPIKTLIESHFKAFS